MPHATRNLCNCRPNTTLGSADGIVIVYIDSIYITYAERNVGPIEDPSTLCMGQYAKQKSLRRPEATSRLKKKETVSLTREERRHVMHLQRFLAGFACGALGFSCLAALTMFALQGFNLWGFRLDVTSLHWLGVTAVGATCGLSPIVYRAIFNRS